jgi:hypothetical protein
MAGMNPEDIKLMSTSLQFEYEKMSREIDGCDDIDLLRQMCKFVVKLEMRTRETYSVILQDTMPGINKTY